MESQNFRPIPIALCLLAFLFIVSSNQAALAQGANLSPIRLNGGLRVAAAGPFGGGDVVPSPGIIPTDITPTRIGEERELLRPGFKFYLMQKLPPRLWFNSVTEVTNRFESNVLFQTRQPRRDYVYRVLPNITVGYNVAPNTSVYANYFLIKDVFARTGFLSNPTFMSLAGGLRHQIPIGTRSNLQADFQVRQLWQARNLRQADMLPGITYTRVFNQKLIGFANTQLQLRSRNIWGTGSFREIDPFFTIGLLGRWKDWNAIATNTFVVNFRNQQAIPQQRNYAVISDFEINRPINKKVPGLLAFFRAEPIWNFGGRGQPGLSGFDFRIFGGLRMSITKPSYYAQMEKLRKQLEQVTENPNAIKKITMRKNKSRIAQSVSKPSQIPVEMAIDIAHDEGLLGKGSGQASEFDTATNTMSAGEYAIRQNMIFTEQARKNNLAKSFSSQILPQSSTSDRTVNPENSKLSTSNLIDAKEKSMQSKASVSETDSLNSNVAESSDDKSNSLETKAVNSDSVGAEESDTQVIDMSTFVRDDNSVSVPQVEAPSGVMNVSYTPPVVSSDKGSELETESKPIRMFLHN